MGEAKPSILIVEDDPAIATAVALNLKVEGYGASVVDDGALAVDCVREQSPSLVLLDISLPNKNGLDVLSELRAQKIHVPVIILSARQDEYDKVAALKLGADDYVTKPFGVAELLARVAAVLRRSKNSPELSVHEPLSFANISVAQDTRTVFRSGDPISLTHLEFELLTFFLRNPARVFSRTELLRQVWEARSGTTRTVDNFVGQLRSKLEENPESPVHFVTVRGSGYRFDP